LGLKVSIITVVHNGEKTIEDSILSVASQVYPNKEHIIIDGSSSDHTISIIEKHKDRIQQIVSEPDKGMYDAMNKGIQLASGDIIGILNADDVYDNRNCISSVVKEFERKNVQAVCGNLVYVSHRNLNKIVRYYNSENFKPYMFAYGIMPAHPAFFVKKRCYEKYGLFKIDYSISADFELLVRFLRTYGLTYSCLPKVLVRMRTGGISTRGIKSNWVINKEIIRACKENKINTNMPKILLKYFIKIFQLIRKPDDEKETMQ
jgi:glycosyltransferase involved in cell wall biosynthesis